MATLRTDLRDRDDVEALLTVFYGRAFADDLLGPIFIDVARMDLQAHLPIICDFWETVLFKAGLYRRNALEPHLNLHRQVPLTQAHFERWLTLWSATLDEHYTGPKAELAKVQASRIAESMQRRLQGRSGSAMETITIGETPAPEG
ncbi:group III truncated hemoglobin [Arthrobacter echini]|uniref:Group III truncated hemoglobin n=1 Tax=Arthrobacter echini TaxID=1529066 RepID=A0A4S5E0T2_9MICC|nr:group III truncated hemoglobin [Arthrobacter echini]THJ64921.1 group III truncated hemoglobin [Arthrobacter echini]